MDANTPQHCTIGNVTTNNEAIQLYFDVRFSRSPRNPLQRTGEYAAFCDSGVVVVFPADPGHLSAFPIEVEPPADFKEDLTNP